MDGEALPGLVALDEPTRGMDRARKDDLVALIGELAGRGAGVVVATHDVEFAAAFAERVVLLGDGVVIADGPAAEVLSGGWYFATEVARVLDLPGVVTPEQGAAVLRGQEEARMSWELVSFLILGAVLLAGFAWYERSRPPSQVVALVAALAALAIAGRIAFAAFPNVKPTTDIVLFAGYALGGAPGFAVGALTALVSNFWFGQGPVDPVADGGLGAVRRARRGAGAGRPQRRPPDARRGLRLRRHRLRRSAELLADGDLRRRPVAASASSCSRRARSRSTSPTSLGNVVFALVAGPGDGADAGPLPRALRVAPAR